MESSGYFFHYHLISPVTRIELARSMCLLVWKSLTSMRGATGFLTTVVAVCARSSYSNCSETAAHFAYRL